MPLLPKMILNLRIPFARLAALGRRLSPLVTLGMVVFFFVLKLWEEHLVKFVPATVFIWLAIVTLGVLLLTVYHETETFPGIVRMWIDGLRGHLPKPGKFRPSTALLRWLRLPLVIYLYWVGLGLWWIGTHGVFKNDPPTILYFDAEKKILKPGEATDLMLRVKDEEHDGLMFLYEVKVGKITDSWTPNEKERYEAPPGVPQPSSVRIEVSVDDGIGRYKDPKRQIRWYLQDYTIVEVTEPAVAEAAWGNFKEGIRRLRDPGDGGGSPQVFDKVVTAVPGFADGFFGRGLSNGTLNDWAPAVADFTTYIELRKSAQQSPVEGYLLRAYSFENLNRKEPAKNDVETVLGLGLEPKREQLLRQYLDAPTTTVRLSKLADTIQASPNPLFYVWQTETLNIKPSQR